MKHFDSIRNKMALVILLLLIVNCAFSQESDFQSKCVIIKDSIDSLIRKNYSRTPGYTTTSYWTCVEGDSAIEGNTAINSESSEWLLLFKNEKNEVFAILEKPAMERTDFKSKARTYYYFDSGSLIASDFLCENYHDPCSNENPLNEIVRYYQNGEIIEANEQDNRIQSVIIDPCNCKYPHPLIDWRSSTDFLKKKKIKNSS